MLCATPFRTKHEEFGCGQCMACRINKQRMWTCRLVLEASMHPFSTFATLTYKVNPVSLKPRDTQLWLHRLRKRIGKFRYYLVGEYGDRTFRPHYHAALFGVHPIAHEQAILETWGHGLIHCGTLEKNSAQYIAQYVTKKMTSAEDPRLQGKHPEFTRMSLKPAIGVPALAQYAAGLHTKGGSLKLLQDGDVPAAARIENKLYPLGRTLRGKLREEVGWSKETPFIYREAKILARADRTPEQVARDERVRESGLARARARATISRQMKVL